MAKKSDKNGSLDRRLAKSVGHPIRIEAMRILNERTASPSELAKALGEGVSHVSYHIQELTKYGCVELVRTEPRRGAVEHFYRVARPNGKTYWHIDDEEASEMSHWDRAELSASALQTAVGEAMAAMRTGSFDARADSHMSCMPMELDEEGWQEMTALLTETLEKALAISAGAAERLGQGDREGIAAMVSMMAFERSESPPVEPSSRNGSSDDPPPSSNGTPGSNGSHPG